MKSFEQFILDNYGIKMPEGNISGAWFAENGFPMVVRCSCCDMTMASPSAWVDEDGDTYCRTCAEVEGE